MSSPRYDWWPYVKGMIRRYPELCKKEAQLHEVSMSINYSGLPGGKGTPSDPTAKAALRELPEINRREMQAVEAAIRATQKLPNGPERMKMVKMIFWDRTHTVYGAAIKLNYCERTVRQWHGDFIREVARNFGLFDVTG